MRLLTLLAAFAAVPLAAHAQEGTVLYDVTVKIDVELPPELASMRDQLPSSQTSQRLLLFDGSTSLMKPAPKKDEPASFEPARSRVVFRTSDEDALYIDRDAGTSVHRRDFLGRTFLIEGELVPPAWRLTDEQAEFLGYPCFKAVLQRDSTTTEAWFTPEIPVSAGPEHYGGLPGLILVLSENDGRRTFAATEVSLAAPADGAIAAPTEGRRVSKEAYERIVREKMEEMGIDRRGGRGGMIIRRN